MTFSGKYKLLIAILSVVFFVFGIGVKANTGSLTLTETSDTARRFF